MNMHITYRSTGCTRGFDDAAMNDSVYINKRAWQLYGAHSTIEDAITCNNKRGLRINTEGRVPLDFPALTPPKIYQSNTLLLIVYDEINTVKRHFYVREKIM